MENQKKRKCPHCGELLDAKSKTCPHCGKALVRKYRKCPNCGEKVLAKATECPYCGEKFAKATVTPTQPASIREPLKTPQSPSVEPADSVPRNAADGFFQQYLINTLLKPYSDFEGRTARKDFWLTVLSLIIVFIGLSGWGLLLIGWFGTMGIVIWSIISFFIVGTLLVPVCAIPCRRLRDAGISPWMILLSLIPFGIFVVLVLLCLPSKHQHPSAHCRFGAIDVLITVLSIATWIYEPSNYEYYELSDDDYAQMSDTIAAPATAAADDFSWMVGRLITEQDIKYLSPDELRLARNSIYARHGYIFRSAELREYFSQFDWYEPHYNDVTGMLTDIEIANVDFLKKHE